MSTLAEIQEQIGIVKALLPCIYSTTLEDVTIYKRELDKLNFLTQAFSRDDSTYITAYNAKHRNYE